MSEIKVIGIDLAKSVFQVCVWMSDGNIASNRKVSRAKLLDTIRQFPPGSMIAMEACATSHYWGRTFQSIGFQVRLIPTQHVKALTHHQKNDANDALAICETAFRPGIHFVAIKTVEQQDIKALRAARQLLFSLLENIHSLNERILTVEHSLAALCQQQPKYKVLMTIPGIGPLIAAAFLSEVNAEQFTNGRQLSAWCGLVPRQHSSGGKSSLSAMTKNGNRDLRTLIIHGARSVMHWAHKRDDALGMWLKRLIERRGKMKATVALANKMTRIVWRLLTESTSFNIDRAFAMN